VLVSSSNDQMTNSRNVRNYFSSALVRVCAKTTDLLHNLKIWSGKPRAREFQTLFHWALLECLGNICQSPHCEVRLPRISELPTPTDDPQIHRLYGHV